MFVLSGPFFDTFREYLSVEVPYRFVCSHYCSVAVLQKPHFALPPYTKAAAEVFYKLIARGEAFERTPSSSVSVSLAHCLFLALIASFWRAIEEIAAVHLLSADIDVAAFALFSSRLSSFLESIQQAHQTAQQQHQQKQSLKASADAVVASATSAPAATTVTAENPFAVSAATSKFLKALFSNSMASARKKGT